MKVIPPQKDSKKPTTLKKNESYTPAKGFKKSDHTKKNKKIKPFLWWWFTRVFFPLKKINFLILFGGSGEGGLGTTWYSDVKIIICYGIVCT